MVETGGGGTAAGAPLAPTAELLLVMELGDPDSAPDPVPPPAAVAAAGSVGEKSDVAPVGSTPPSPPLLYPPAGAHTPEGPSLFAGMWSGCCTPGGGTPMGGLWCGGWWKCG